MKIKTLLFLATFEFANLYSSRCQGMDAELDSVANTPRTVQALSPSSSGQVQAPIKMEAAPQALSGTENASISKSSSAEETGSDLLMPEYTITAKSDFGKLDESRDKNLLPKLGASSYTLTSDAIKALPQGENTPIDKVLLQAPGISYDSAISNPDFHVRNEYANVQYRLNGIQLPDGVSALGPILETNFIGKLNLLDGALPAQYGLRTAGVVDITTKERLGNGGNLDVYGGTWDTISPSLQYGGELGQTQYFLSARYLQSEQGLENAMPTPDPIHDATEQEKFFGYASTLFTESVRLSYMAGAFAGDFQIPDLAGQTPLGDFGPSALDSTQINENESDHFYFGLLALQTHNDRIDTQVSLYTRYASTQFAPDIYNDLAFNDVATSVSRQSQLSSLQMDTAERLGQSNSLRAGIDLNIENTQVDDLATVLPLDSSGNPLPNPESINDATDLLGWSAGAYLQDEWKLFESLSLNLGLRFDQMQEFVTANQLSPRFAFVYKPFSETTLHAGVSRYFTPPMQAQSTPNNLALFQNTTQQPNIPLNDPVQPERATYYDVGLDQNVASSLSLGLDAYEKDSTDTLDDGQFGQAVVLDQYNYASGYSRGMEFKMNYIQGGLRLYANASYEITMVEDVVSSEYVIGDPNELSYLSNHYISSSDAQTISASFGASYAWHGLLASIDGLHGSGLASGFANQQNSPPYTQWNAAIAQSFYPWGSKSITLRLNAINLFDEIYVLRSGSGVGEFAPQYGPRRGLFAELSQKF